jgi:hypothetical protein
MPLLSAKDLKKILLEYSSIYRESYKEEISLMTEIKDPDHTIKTIEKSREWYEILMMKYCLERRYK